jgi:hypothetical protein
MQPDEETDDVVQSGTSLMPAGDGTPALAIDTPLAADSGEAATWDGALESFLPAASGSPLPQTSNGNSSAHLSGADLEGRITQLRADLDALEQLVVTVSPLDPTRVRGLVESSMAELRSELEPRFGRLQSQHAATTALLDSTTSEFDALLDRLRPGEVEVLRQELAAIRGQVKERDHLLREMDVELRALRAAGVSELQAQLGQREAALRSREEAVAAREAMQIELDDLRLRNQDLEAARARYEQHQDATERDAGLRTRNAELERDLQSKENQLEEMGYQLTAAQNDAKNQSRTLATVRQSHERLVSRARDLEQQVHDLKTQLAPLQKDLEQLRGLEPQLRQEAEERRRVQDELFEGRQQRLLQATEEWKLKVQTEAFTKNAGERADFILRCTRAETRVVTLEERLKRAKEDLKAALEREQALSLNSTDMERQVRTQTALVGELEGDVQRLKNRRDELDAFVAQLEEKTEARRTNAREEADRYLEELRSEKATLQGLVQERQQEATEYAERVQSLKEWYKEERADRLKELALLDERIADVRRLEHARLDASERIRSIHEPCFVGETLRAPGARPASETAWLEDVARGIEDLGFSYPRRLLDAFHTSLKIAEWSPLTMLAGISGTGKSELPRLYAHLGGVHFLATPVQPNWDSPQDLFGFFNYMDGRYKATDLLRALAQSQRSREEGGFDDSMLIVLLDEMNLARIELYFSELLSRLESRRGVSASSREARMPIDVGSGNRPFELQLRRNVLYVGTMNEDETTQTISDKVLDRGNVLTFPRPTRLRSRRLAELPECTTALPLTVWSEWVREPADALHQEVREAMRSALECVNEGMERVQRAIGHRVLQSIEAYVANHPKTRQSADDRDGADSSWKLAFEDQLAQKIMPKLRGIDGHSDSGRAALSTIRGVLEQVAPQLVKDFDEAERADDGVFAWRNAHFLEASSA